MPEVYTSANQKVGMHATSLIEACQELGITVMTSASIFQSRLTRNLPVFVVEHLEGLKTDGQRAIQFVRSTRGVTTALVGMSRVPHVEENLATASVAPSSDSVRRMVNAP